MVTVPTASEPAVPPVTLRSGKLMDTQGRERPCLYGRCLHGMGHRLGHGLGACIESRTGI